ncbi:MAG: 1-acyl-sn-glycerol-3-phosphate acyltransferase [Woeseiaceae bacterium]
MLKKIAEAIVRASGWTVAAEVPSLDKAVYIAAPHTSNWDAFWLLVAKTVIGLKACFLAKHTLFWWPLGAVLKRFGAIPIDRSRGAGVVPELVRKFRDCDRLSLGLAPEGTRKWKPYWKTGFYRIAVEADVPIVLCFIDYGSKTMGIGGIYKPTGDQEKDLSYLRNFYAQFTPRRPDKMGPVAFPP